MHPCFTLIAHAFRLKKMKIKVIDQHSNQILKEFNLDDGQTALEFASNLEELGVDVKIEHPSTIETLAQALGSEGEELEEITRGLQTEIEHHQSCCMEKSETMTPIKE